jgi:hypothetical protein
MAEGRGTKGLLASACAIAACWAPGTAGAATLPVACEEASLVAAIETANAEAGSDVLELAVGCTYEFAAPYASDGTEYDYWYGPSALPAIASDITLEGNGATIARASGSPPFRLFFVGANPADPDTFNYATPGAGVLTGRDVTLRGGLAEGGRALSGGGGAGLGGAIYNQGRVVLDRSNLTSNAAVGGGTDEIGFDPSGGGIGQDAGPAGGGGFGGGTSFGGAGGGAGGDFSGGGGGGFRASDNGAPG